MSGSEIAPDPGGRGHGAAERGRGGPRWRPPFSIGTLLLVMLLLAGPAIAQTVQRVALDLTVSHASLHPGPIDPAAAQLHEQLRDDFRYQSLRVIERRRLDLRTGEVGGLELPTGKRVRVRPLHMGAGGVLLAVDIENTMHSDMRVPDRQPVVIGVDRYDDGKLILTLEPRLPAE